MSLSSALSSAKTSLLATAKQTSVLSRNIAGANDVNYTRKLASVVSGPYGSVHVDISRSADDALLTRFIQSNSQASSASALSAGLERLSAISSADNYSGSPAAMIGDLRDALLTYATSPGNAALGDSAISRAMTLASGLNDATRQVQALRADADSEIGASVNHINDLLGRFEQLNTQIVNGSRSGSDVSDLLDQRDGLLKDLSGEIGVNTLVRGDNDMVIFAENGVTLFETSARKVGFAPSTSFSPGSSGNGVYVDGVPLNHDTFDQPFGTGRLSGLMQLRDQIAPQYQNQLDEIARGLVEMFAEHDQSGNGGASRTGLFTYSGSPVVPPSGQISAGIAGTIKVSSAFIRAEGGNPELLRDGGANGTDYIYNGTHAAGFSDRLRALNDGFSQQMSFDSTAGVSANRSLIDYATSSTSWLEAQRKSADGNFQYASTLASRAEQALANMTGVDINTEMALLLDLEHSYKASSRILATVDSMMNDLFAAVR